MQSNLNKWWLGAIEPSSNTVKPEDRHKQRLLNMLLLIFAPVSIIFAIIDNLGELRRGSPLLESDTLVVVAGIIVILSAIYYFSHRGKYNTIIPILMLIGSAIIYVNATITSPPHTEIIYLSLVIFLASDLFRPRVTVAVAIMTIAILTVYYTQTPTMPSEQYTDLRLYLIISTIFTFFISYHRDQLETDRQQIILQERLRLQLVLENLPAYVWTTSEDFSTTSINGTLREENEIQLRDFLMSDVAKQFYSIALDQSKIYFEFEMNQHAHEGVIQAIKSPIDRHVEYIGVAIDVSDRKEREKLRTQQMRQLQQQQVVNDLLNSVSHDLRTPLTLLRTSTYMLERVNDPVKRQSHIEKINRATTRLEKTIESMFKLVRLNMPLDTTNEHLALHEMIDYALAGLQYEIAQKHISIRKSYMKEDTIIEAVEAEITDALEHIIHNAIQYSREGSSIIVRTQMQNELAIIEIEDQGVGITEEDLPKIFDAFFRADAHRPMDNNSIGIGLTIAKGILEQHKGTITVDSVEGTGTTITMSLPTATIT